MKNYVERFSEEHLTCGIFYKTILMRLIYNKCRKLKAKAGELDCMGWG